MKQFQQELAQLKQRVMDMGSLAESMVAGRLAPSSRTSEPPSSRSARANRARSFSGRDRPRGDPADHHLLAVAKDLRFLLMIAADQLGARAHRRSGGRQLRVRGAAHRSADRRSADLSKMSEIVLGMVHDALRAFQEEDTEIAQAVIKLDDQVDAMNAQIFRDLLGAPGRRSGHPCAVHESDSRRAIPGAHCRPCDEHLRGSLLSRRRLTTSGTRPESTHVSF